MNPNRITGADQIRAVTIQRDLSEPDKYTIDRPYNLFHGQVRDRAVLKLLVGAGHFPLSAKSILDIGCGSGGGLIDFLLWGATLERLAGIDLVEARVERARERLPGADIRSGDAQNLPWNSGSFDVVLQFTSFSSMPNPAMRRAVANEMARVLAPGGVILWYDLKFNSPGNRNVHGISKAEVAKLFPDFQLSARRLTVAPPVARWLVPKSWLLAECLESTRVLNTHLLVRLQK